MEKNSWNVVYPEGLIKYIDLFRKKYFQYDKFDKVVSKYISDNSKIKCDVICSLGSGTGHHEVELSKLGYKVIGLERNKESIEIAQKHIDENKANVTLYKCDFLIKEDLDKIMNEIGQVDAVVLLLIPISVQDYKKIIQNMYKWLKTGGMFLVDNFGYAEEIDTNKLITTSDAEVVEDIDGKHVVRINYYEFKDNIAEWDAIYFYNDEKGQLQMSRDHDVLDIIPEIKGGDPLNLDIGKYRVLPSYRIVECEDCICPPYLYEYLLGWVKK